MAKSKFTDDEIYALIDEGKTNAQIARAMGMTQGSVNTRINRLRAQGEKAKEETKPPESKPEAFTEPKDNPFPFERNEQIMYDGRLHIVNSVGQDRMIIRENATLTPKTITADDFEKNKALFKKLKPKSENQYENITRNRPDEEPEKLKHQPATEQKTKFEQVAERLKENEKASSGMSEAIADTYGLPAKEPKKPGMTINPVFEAAVQEMEAQYKAKKEPIKLDLEIESSADPVNPFTRESEGYIDPAYSFDRKPEPVKPEIRDYLSDINQLLDILIGDCTEPEMAEQTKKLICYKLVIGFKREIGQEAGV